MAQSDRKPSTDECRLGFGSSFAAGAMMLSHMNRSGLSRYDDLLADLARLQSQQQAQRMVKRADRPQRTTRWVSWIYR